MNQPANLIGTWKILSFQFINKTLNKTADPFGKEPVGTLIFSEDGYLSVAIMAAGRTPLSVENMSFAPAEEKAKAAESYLSYSGTWNVKDDKIVVDVLVSLIPNWTNKSHYRYFRIEGNRLALQTPVSRQGDSEVLMELVWERA